MRRTAARIPGLPTAWPTSPTTATPSSSTAATRSRAARFTYWLYSRSEERSRIPAELLNLGAYHFITLGNHDFNYGVRELETYLDALRARCLCANVEGLRGVEKTAVVALKNGLRIGLTGVTSHFIPQHLGEAGKPRGHHDHRCVSAAARKPLGAASAKVDLNGLHLPRRL